ncbi:Arylesterase [Fusarium oxysporum f. sp. raphani]|nr:Arylesterase [Fusarium oxysporum f. sp. raphani]
MRRNSDKRHDDAFFRVIYVALLPGHSFRWQISFANQPNHSLPFLLTDPAAMSWKPLALDPRVEAKWDSINSEEALAELSRIELPNSIKQEDKSFPGPNGNELVVSIFRRKISTNRKRLCIYHIHGGGMIAGDRFLGVNWYFDVIDRYDVVLVTIEYRLAPANPYPAPVEDCYAGMIWTVEHADELGIDADKILTAGGSAGGGLCVAMNLLLRDRKGPKVIGQFLLTAMLDDRVDTISAHQTAHIKGWNRDADIYGWTCYLGELRETDSVSPYAAPSRATDLSGLPPTYLDVGAVDVFRDEDVKFALDLCRDGVPCEFHLWPGYTHGTDAILPDIPVSAAANRVKKDWLERFFADNGVKLVG